MRILFLLQRYPGFGGIETVTRMLAERFMANYGHEVSIFSTSRQDVATQLLDNDLFRYKCCNKKKAEAISEFKEFVSQIRPEIVIYQDSYVDDSELLEVLPSDVKVIVCEHNTPDALQIGLKSVINDLPWTSPVNLLRKLRLPYQMWKLRRRCVAHHRRLYSLSDRYVLLSDSYRQILKKEYGVEGEKLLAIPNPSSICQKTISEDDIEEKKNVVLFVARLTAQKGVKYLLDIWKKVEPECDWNLVIVGDGDLMEWTRSEIKRLKLQRITLEGFQKDVASYYKEASVHLMTSIYEGFAMTNIEAITYGVIPFAFGSFASVGDIISDNEDGFIITPFDTDEYASRLLEFMQFSDDKKMKMRKKAIEKSRTFSADVIADRWNKLFTDIL